jgi:hypothetical protein
MAIKKTVAKGKKAEAPKPAFTLKQVLKKFESEAEAHRAVVKSIFAKVAPGARLITAAGETDKP